MGANGKSVKTMCAGRLYLQAVSGQEYLSQLTEFTLSNSHEMSAGCKFR